jgi:hypothetical protein
VSTPRTDALIEHIRQRDGQVGVGLRNAPEEWVVLCRGLERELDILRTAFGITPSERVVPEQTPTFGSVLVDSGSTRSRISPVNDEVIQLECEIAEARAVIAELLAKAVPAAAESGDAGMVYVEMTEAEWQRVVEATVRAKAFLAK